MQLHPMANPMVDPTKSTALLEHNLRAHSNKVTEKDISTLERYILSFSYSRLDPILRSNLLQLQVQKAELRPTRHMTPLHFYSINSINISIYHPLQGTSVVALYGGMLCVDFFLLQ